MTPQGSRVAPYLRPNPKSLAFRILGTRSRKVMVDTPFESLDFKLFIFGHHLKDKFQIATESFECHENLANFIVGYLSDFLLNWYVRHGVGKLKIHTLRKIQKI